MNYYFPPTIPSVESQTLSPIPLSETSLIEILPLEQDQDGVFNPARYNSGLLEIEFTLGSLDSADIKIYYTLDGTSWKQLTVQDVASGTITLTNAKINLNADFNGYFDFPIPAVRGIKITVQGQGADNTGSSIKVRLSARVS